MDKSTYNKICFGHSFDRIVDNLALKIEQNAVDHIVYSTSKSDIRFPHQIYWACCSTIIFTFWLCRKQSLSPWVEIYVESFNAEIRAEKEQ